jgi:hypothetical protein
MLAFALILAVAATRPTTGPSDAEDLRAKLYLLLYCLPVVHWWVRQGFDPNDEDDRHAVKWATHFLAPLWPVLLLALLANRDPKKK